jgi:hypothetical protein
VKPAAIRTSRPTTTKRTSCSGDGRRRMLEL